MKWQYVHKVMNRKSFPDFFNELGCKVDWKEWSEIYAMYKIALDQCEKNDFQPDYIFDIGCGKRPTLGTFLALNVKSFKQILCIDPQIDKNLCENVEGLASYQGTLVQFINSIDWVKSSTDKKVLILCNHSHVSKNEIKRFTEFFKEYIYITCPCCVDNKLDNGEYYTDHKVNSNKNIFYVSNNLNI